METRAEITVHLSGLKLLARELIPWRDIQLTDKLTSCLILIDRPDPPGVQTPVS